MSREEQKLRVMQLFQDEESFELEERRLNALELDALAQEHQELRRWVRENALPLNAEQRGSRGLMKKSHQLEREADDRSLEAQKKAEKKGEERKHPSTRSLPQSEEDEMGGEVAKKPAAPVAAGEKQLTKRRVPSSSELEGRSAKKGKAAGGSAFLRDSLFLAAGGFLLSVALFLVDKDAVFFTPVEEENQASASSWPLPNNAPGAPHSGLKGSPTPSSSPEAAIPSWDQSRMFSGNAESVMPVSSSPMDSFWMKKFNAYDEDEALLSTFLSEDDVHGVESALEQSARWGGEQLRRMRYTQAIQIFDGVLRKLDRYDQILLSSADNRNPRRLLSNQEGHATTKVTMTREMLTLELGFAKICSNLFQEGAALVQSSLETDDSLRSQRPDALNALGYAYAHMQHFGRARNTFQLASITLKPSKPLESAAVWNNFGAAAMMTGEHAEADQAFLNALSLRPKYPLALRNLLNLRQRTFEFEPELDLFISELPPPRKAPPPPPGVAKRRTGDAVRR